MNLKAINILDELEISGEEKLAKTTKNYSSFISTKNFISSESVLQKKNSRNIFSI